MNFLDLHVLYLEGCFSHLTLKIPSFKTCSDRLNRKGVSYRKPVTIFYAKCDTYSFISSGKKYFYATFSILGLVWGHSSEEDVVLHLGNL